ncbi:hypothetical protein [Paenibacillus sp. HW567]|uniref:hypothetical protein n=1 Tax=Paenibacillus sp. HW567 TaxID=1034769 RepID=UPI000382A4C6|nr:hypothetical protein [Paenibacillus sp. HW567]
MDERLQFDGAGLVFQTALDDDTRSLIAWHFKSGWHELQQAVRLTALTADNKFAQFLFPVDRPLGQALDMQIPRPGNRYYYADLGIIKKCKRLYRFRDRIFYMFLTMAERSLWTGSPSKETMPRLRCWSRIRGGNFSRVIHLWHIERFGGDNLCNQAYLS